MLFFVPLRLRSGACTLPVPPLSLSIVQATVYDACEYIPFEKRPPRVRCRRRSCVRRELVKGLTSDLETIVKVAHWAWRVRATDI